MSKTYKTIITPEAAQDIRKIVLYIAETIGNPQSALSLNDLLNEKISSLSLSPERNKTISEKPWGEIGVRKLLVKNYYIYYYIDEPTATVYIIAVIYTRMNQQKQLNEKLK